MQSQSALTFSPQFSPTLLAVLFLTFSLIAEATEGQAQSTTADRSNGEIAGTILLAGENLPAAQVAVSLRSKVSGVFRSFLTDQEGHFDVQGLPPGSYDIVAEEMGYDSVRTNVSLDGTTSNLILHLNPVHAAPRTHGSETVSVRRLKIPDKAFSEYQRGLQSLAKNDPQGSLGHFVKAASAFRGYFEAYYHTGVAQLRLGHRDEAMQAFQKAVDLSDGKYAKAEFGVAAVLCESGDAREAESIVRRGLEEDENASEGHVLLGIVLLRLARTEEAEKSLREALLRSPANAEAYLLSSDIHAYRGEYREQLRDLETYLALRPNGPARTRVLRARELVQRTLAKKDSQQQAASR